MLNTEFYLKSFLKYVYLSELEKGFATIDDFCSITNLTRDLCEKIFHELTKMRLIEELRGAEGLKYRLTRAGREKIKVVVTGGVFDVIHVGHLAALEEAKSLGDILIAVIASDSTVKKMRGKNPVFPENQRRILLEGLKPIDKALVGFEEMNLRRTIEELKPDIVAVGYDQNSIESSVREAIRELRVPVRVIKLKKYDFRDLDSSTKVKIKVVKEGV
ncbi:MAG: adenylyltransferase/cytidyltransferase family protein [Candidatus Bathyarchaeia archaeon]